MQITSTATPASSSGWAIPEQGQAQPQAMTGVAGATGIPVGESAESGESGSEESLFGGTLAMAEMLANSAKPAPTDPKKVGLGTAGQKGSAIQASSQADGRFNKNVPRGVGGSEEQGALIQKMAVSSNTGAEVAGLKPWSRDWVMEGGLNRHPAQQTLVQGEARGDSADALSQLANLAKLVRASTEEASGSANAARMMQESGQGEAASAADLGPVPMAAQAMLASGEPAPTARKSALGGDDYLNLRQALAGEQSQPAAAVSGRNLKVVPGGATASVGDPAPELKGEKGRLSEGGLPKKGLTSSLGGGVGNDTLGLIHPEMNGKTAAQAASSLPFAAALGTMKLDGAVVPGSMQRNRLSSESVMGVSENIRLLTTSGGGEMRIRLKPDHLGELHLKVSSSGRAGNEIGLQIQASDDRARQIIEESISSLKESLSAQSLNLSKVDVQVAGPSLSQFDTSSNQQGQGSQGQMNQDLGAMLDQGGRRQFEQGSEGRSDAAARDPGGRPEGLRSASASKAYSATAPSGRIDVMA